MVSDHQYYIMLSRRSLTIFLLIGIGLAVFCLPACADCQTCPSGGVVTSPVPTDTPTLPPTTAPFPTESPTKTASPTTSPSPSPSPTSLPPGPGGSLPLLTGWNCVTVPAPLAPDFQKAGLLFWGVDTGGHSLYTYRADTGAWTIMTFDSAIVPLDGIWVYSVTSTRIPFQYSSAPPPVISKSLSKGWNLMGFAITEPRSARDTMISVRDSWNYIIGYDAAVQQSETTIVRGSTDPAFSDSRLLSPLKGYWVAMSKAAVYQG